MMAKLIIVLVASFLVISLTEAGVEILKAKLRNRFGGRGAHASASAPGGYGGYGGTTSSAALGGVGPRGGYSEYPADDGYGYDRRPPHHNAYDSYRHAYRRHPHGARYPQYPIGGSAASSAAAATGGYYSAGDGIYSNRDLGKEKSAYRRATENRVNHENGHANDNHYYNANSYGKSKDENIHEAFNKNDEDVEETPHLFRSKKSDENYVLDYNKAKRLSGSGVMAKDRHSSAFNKNSRKFNENVDQRHAIRGPGIVDNLSHATVHGLHDADEEVFDSDGLGYHGGHPVSTGGGTAAAAAATSSF